MNCEYKRLNSSIFKNSTILTQEESVKLVNLIELNKNWTLIYQGSVHGFNAINFHKNCDNISNVLVVIKSNNSNVFGGYTSVGWTSSNGSYSYDSSAFLFSLTNTYNRPVKLNVTDPNFAIYSFSKNGPVFGSGDLYISNFSSSNSNSFSYSNLGYSYEIPSFINSTVEFEAFLAGSFYFSVLEIEVYTENRNIF